MRDGHQLPQLLAHLTGPLTDVTVQAFGVQPALEIVLRAWSDKGESGAGISALSAGFKHSPCEGDPL